MWDYTGRRDPTRFSSDELREAEIDDGVCVITSLKKKSIVPKNFGTENFQQVTPPHRGMHHMPFNWIFSTFDSLPVES
jgi:hypothetical protein